MKRINDKKCEEVVSEYVLKKMADFNSETRTYSEIICDAQLEADRKELGELFKEIARFPSQCSYHKNERGDMGSDYFISITFAELSELKAKYLG